MNDKSLITHAVLDRIVSSKAVFLVEEIKKEFVISIESLEEEFREGEWFLVEIWNDNIVWMENDRDLSRSKRAQLRAKVDKLKKRSKKKNLK